MPTTRVPGKAYARIDCVTAKRRCVPSFETNVAGMKKLAPNIKILPVQYTGGEPADAATAVNNVLRANSDLVGIFSTFEPSVLGTISALAGSSKKSQITHVGYDADAAEVEGVNDKAELAARAAVLQERINRRHMLAGVTLLHPPTTFIDDAAPESCRPRPPVELLWKRFES